MALIPAKTLAALAVRKGGEIAADSIGRGFVAKVRRALNGSAPQPAPRADSLGEIFRRKKGW